VNKKTHPVDNNGTISNRRREKLTLKATGIVRRIDDLGRVVIPKEIRRTLRIRAGDPLEIFTDAEGGVIFKKYSAVGEMSAFAAQYADVLSKISNRPALVCDCDHVIAVAGASRKEYMERRVSQDLEEAMHARNTYVRDQNSPPLQPVEGISRAASVVYPIIASSDVVGAVVLLAGDSAEQPDASDIKLTQAAASFLARQMES
jgi:AbrB family transcriptional regulator (stage V sporulation protein T)